MQGGLEQTKVDRVAKVRSTFFFFFGRLGNLFSIASGDCPSSIKNTMP
jgi:hypothetical protein